MNNSLVVATNHEFEMEMLEMRLELGLFSWIGKAFRSVGRWFKKNIDAIKTAITVAGFVISLF